MRIEKLDLITLHVYGQKRVQAIIIYSCHLIFYFKGLYLSGHRSVLRVARPMSMKLGCQCFDVDGKMISDAKVVQEEAPAGPIVFSSTFYYLKFMMRSLADLKSAKIM